MATLSSEVFKSVTLAAWSWADSIERADPSERVVVSRKDFNDKLRGRSFQRWKDFKQTLGPDAEPARNVAGELRLMSGLSITFVIILNVLIFAFIAYIVTRLGKERERYAMWASFALLSVYGLLVTIYCYWAYEQEEQRVITYFMFGLVPFTISAASYILAGLLLDLLRSATTEEGFKTSLWDRMNPWASRLDGRFIFFLAVLPGLLVSIHLGNTVSTGFDNGAIHLDILSLCLFVDVFRSVGHFAYLLAPVWSIGESPDAISSRPGLCYVFYMLCLAWYFVLARLEAVKSGVLLADQTKIHTLACLTSYTFFPLSLYLTIKNMQEFFELFIEQRVWLQTLLLLSSVALTAAFMLLVAMYFDAIEPNLMGIGAIIWVVIYAAYKLSHDSLLGFIIAMIPLSVGAFGAVFLAVQHAAAVREALHVAFAW